MKSYQTACIVSVILALLLCFVSARVSRMLKISLNFRAQIRLLNITLDIKSG